MTVSTVLLSRKGSSESLVVSASSAPEVIKFLANVGERSESDFRVSLEGKTYNYGDILKFAERLRREGRDAKGGIIHLFHKPKTPVCNKTFFNYHDEKSFNKEVITLSGSVMSDPQRIHNIEGAIIYLRLYIFETAHDFYVPVRVRVGNYEASEFIFTDDEFKAIRLPPGRDLLNRYDSGDELAIRSVNLSVEISLGLPTISSEVLAPFTNYYANINEKKPLRWTQYCRLPSTIRVRRSSESAYQRRMYRMANPTAPGF